LAGLFAAASFAGLPAIGINISSCPAAAFFGFLAGLFGAVASLPATPH
jgi:hypothetical protein